MSSFDPIDRRTFLMGTAGAALAGALAEPAGAAPAARRPNILFVFSDQQRWDTVECYGRPIFPGLTPNLDRMAREGTRFEHGFTCQPVCGPARSCLQTGKWATETGCFRNDVALPLEEKTIAHRLSEAGYSVGYVGKWHLASQGKEINYRTVAVPPERRGGYKDYWVASDVLEFTSHGYDGHMFGADMQPVEFAPDRYRADCVTDCALDAIAKLDSRRPFFLFVSFIEPHHQNDHNHFEGPHGSKERFKEYRVPGDLVGTQGDWRAEMPDYLGCCHNVDQNLGRLRAELQRRGIADNTVVIYTSDHGCHFRTRNGEYKRCCHEDTIHVPMIACGPGFQGGKVVHDLVSLMDLPPTLMAAGGVPVPESMRGRPLQPLAAGKAKEWPQEVFLQISESQVGRAIRTNKWKYSVRAPGKGGGKDMNSDLYAEDFLYDLEKDQDERHNLVDDPALAGVRADLAATLKRRMVAAGEKEPEIRAAGGK